MKRENATEGESFDKACTLFFQLQKRRIYAILALKGIQ